MGVRDAALAAANAFQASGALPGGQGREVLARQAIFVVVGPRRVPNVGIGARLAALDIDLVAMEVGLLAPAFRRRL
jgi:hypothetical protein